MLILLLLFPFTVSGKPLQVAVASNFKTTFDTLAAGFERQYDHKITVISGATGKQYGQILHGAPFDVFFAADSTRPEMLEKQGKTVTNSRFTYAIGQLALYTPEQPPAAGYLESNTFNHLAIANPRLAPYGLAAQQYLEHLNLWQPLQGKLVRGENISQAWQFVHSGNADAGLLALSQLILGTVPKDRYRLIPAALYSPIIQQAVILKASPAAQQLSAYIQSDKARNIIASGGYILPDKKDIKHVR